MFIAERRGLLKVFLRRLGGSSPSCAHAFLFDRWTVLDGRTLAKPRARHKAVMSPGRPANCTDHPQDQQDRLDGVVPLLKLA
jgi:hypothetical protein